MSNAMRSGKRWLAGVAAGALGAGMLVGLASAPAANAVVSTVTLDNSGLQVVQGIANNDDTAAFPVTIALTDSLGDTINLDANESMSATVTSWPGFPTVAWVDDSFVGVSPNEVYTNNDDTISTFARPFGATGAGVGIYRFWVVPPDNANADGWDNATAIGAYTIRVRVTNTQTGAFVDRNFPVTVSAAGITPLGTVTFTNQAGTAVVNAASDDSGTNANTKPFYFKLTNSAGQALMMPGSLTASFSTGTVANGNNDATVIGGVMPNTPRSNNAVYTVQSGQASAFQTGNRSLTVTYATPTPTTATLPLTISTGGVANPSAVILTTTPATPLVTPGPPNYTVPRGTTTLTFVGTTTSTSGTIAWSAASNANGAQITPSAGVASVSSTGSFTATVTLNAAAASSGRVNFTTAGGINVSVDPAALTLTLASSTPVVGKVGSAVTVTGTLTDQFERPVAGIDTVSIARTTAPATGALDQEVVADDGSFSLTIPAANAPAAAADIVFTITGQAGGLLPATWPITVQYTATGEVTSLTVLTTPTSTGGSVPATLVPGGGTVNLANSSTAIVNPASIPAAAPAGTNAVTVMTFTSVPATALTVTGSEGVYFSTAATGTVNWNGGTTSASINSGGSLTIWSTKAGANTVTVTGGGKTTTQQFVAFTQAAFARNVALTPAKIDVDRNTFTTLTLKVTDVFENPIRSVNVGTAATNPGVTLGAAGGGGIGTLAGTTDAAGEYAFAYTAPNASGTALITAAGAGAAFAASITGAPAAKTSATSEVTVRGEAPAKSILIVGERTTVSGKSGILVEGSVTGIENGKTVTPFIRFPGETTFSAGSARPVITAGEFTWQRKTGKRVTVFVEHDGVRSNRVTIQAS